MKQEIKNGIEEYVLQEINKLKDLSESDEKYTEMANNGANRIKTLIDLLQKEDVNINEFYLENRKIDDTEIKNNSDVDLKKKELNINYKRDVELRNDRIIKVLVDGATIIVPVVFYNIWMNRGFKFEETGTYCSSTFKNLMSKFKPTK